MTPLRRIGFGIAFSGFAWIAAGAIQLAMDGGDAVSNTWQMLPYLLQKFGEVLVSATGLEFAYSQAPLSMKVNATARNKAVISGVAETGLTESAFLMFFVAAFALVVAFGFGWYPRRYPMRHGVARRAIGGSADREGVCVRVIVGRPTYPQSDVFDTVLDLRSARLAVPYYARLGNVLKHSAAAHATGESS